MELRFHSEPRKFVALVTPFYASDTLRHTVALTLLARVLPTDLARAPIMATLHDNNGTVAGVALRTPPWPVVSSGLPTDAGLLDEFVAGWLERDPDLPGASGPRACAEAVAAAWVRHTGGAVREIMATRLFRLGTLVPPATSGAGRAATAADLELVLRWRMAFDDEAVGTRHPREEIVASVRRMVDQEDSIFLWEDGGKPVSWAVASTPVWGMSRVGPVYTPPEHRGRGYGSAVTAAVSAAAGRAGAHDVVLFADVANPVSNAIYQQLGYRPLYDSTELRFTRLPSTV